MQSLQDAIILARKYVEEDPNLAMFIVRDFPELKKWQLDDLAWALYQNTIARSEAAWFLDKLESHLNSDDKGGT